MEYPFNVIISQELYVNGESVPFPDANVTVIRDAVHAHAVRIQARDEFADRLRVGGLMMTPEAERQWYGPRGTV